MRKPKATATEARLQMSSASDKLRVSMETDRKHGLWSEGGHGAAGASPLCCCCVTFTDELLSQEAFDRNLGTSAPVIIKCKQ